MSKPPFSSEDYSRRRTSLGRFLNHAIMFWLDENERHPRGPPNFKFREAAGHLSNAMPIQNSRLSAIFAET